MHNFRLPYPPKDSSLLDGHREEIAPLQELTSRFRAALERERLLAAPLPDLAGGIAELLRDPNLLPRDAVKKALDRGAIKPSDVPELLAQHALYIDARTTLEDFSQQEVQPLRAEFRAEFQRVFSLLQIRCSEIHRRSTKPLVDMLLPFCFDEREALETARGLHVFDVLRLLVQSVNAAYTDVQKGERVIASWQQLMPFF
jgi:hypothetical protein